jgi:hypothetical protein
MAGAKGPRHRELQVPLCPKCRCREIEVVGPVRPWKDLEKAPVNCRGCGNGWMSENRQLMKLAAQLYPVPA